jgi:hypothetical protein
MEVTNKLSFLDLMHVVPSKKLTIILFPFQCVSFGYYYSPIKIFPLCFVIVKNKWVVKDVDVVLYSRKLMAHASNAATFEKVSFHLTITCGICMH